MTDPTSGGGSLPPLRPFPDRALRWLLESPANLRALLRIAHPLIADRIDCSSGW